HDEAVRRVREEGAPVDRHREAHRAARRWLLHHDLVEPDARADRQRARRRLDRDLDHEALLDAVVAREESFERYVKLTWLRLREVAEAAEVDAEDGHVVGRHEAYRPQHGAVTTHAHGQVDPEGQLVRVARPLLETRLTGVGRGHAHLMALCD